jgi:hypothetical protein
MLAPISELSTIFEIAKTLFESIELENRTIRLLGISLSNLDNAKLLDDSIYQQKLGSTYGNSVI